MGKFSEFLNRKIFGIKYLYLVAVFVLVLAVMAWKMKPGLSDEETTGATDPATGEDGLYDPTGDALAPSTSYPDTDGSGTVTQGGGGGTTTDPVYTQPQASEDNTTWGRKAISWLITQNVSPDSATVAIQKYLGGDQLSYDEGQLRDRAIRQFGLPPEIPASGGTASKPTTPTKPQTNTPTGKPPLVHTVAGTSDNTYGELAKKYYGSNADRYIDLIQGANTQLGHAAPSGGWKKGTKVFIPAKREPKYFTATKAKRTAAQIAGANGISVRTLQELNDTVKFPVGVGKKVRVA